jgi:hypothetical protein
MYRGEGSAHHRIGGAGLAVMPARKKGRLDRSGMGHKIKAVLAERGLSYTQAAEKMNAFGIVDPHGGSVNKDRLASYVLGRVRTPAWFLDGMVVAFGLPREHFTTTADASATKIDRQTSTERVVYSHGVRMRRVPLLHLWEGARLHGIMESKGAWEGQLIDVPDWIEGDDVMCARIDTDIYRDLLERGDAILLKSKQPLRFDLDYIVTIKETGSPDIARCRRGESGTMMDLHGGGRSVSADDIHAEALITGELPQYNPARPKGSFDPDGYVLRGRITGS